MYGNRTLLTTQEQLLVGIELLKGDLSTQEICIKYGIDTENLLKIKDFLIENISIVFKHHEIVNKLHNELEVKNKEIQALNLEINKKDSKITKFCTNKMIDYDILLKSYGH
jgi:hypothetical protein